MHITARLIVLLALLGLTVGCDRSAPEKSPAMTMGAKWGAKPVTAPPPPPATPG